MRIARTLLVVVVMAAAAACSNPITAPAETPNAPLQSGGYVGSGG